MKAKVLFDFILLNVPEKIAFGDLISSNFKRLAEKFVKPDLDLEIFDDDLKRLRLGHINAQNGGKTEKALLNQYEEKVDDDLRILARYGERIADGDEALLISLGFRLVRSSSTHQYVELSVEAGDVSGSVVLCRHSVDGAKTYLWQQRTESGEWTFAGATTKCKTTLSGLTPVTRYYFRVAVVSAAGTSAYSEAVTKVVE